MEYNEEEYITVSHVLEYLFCPRFTYYEYVLQIPEHQEQRYKVIKGREIHKDKETINAQYLRKKLGVVAKELSVPIYCPALRLKGVLDEVLTLQDATMAPLDYKYAECKDTIFDTHRVQAILYGLLIEYTYHKPVTRAFVCYTRSNCHIETIDIGESDKQNAVATLRKVYEVIKYGFFPRKTYTQKACDDCCYRNICV